jgi:phosphoribosylamine--glycine ligase / phosphoribosylformylglycinamidine cyclo-ligase
MRFLVVGSGAREQAIVLSLKKGNNNEVHCIGEIINDNIKQLCTLHIKHNIYDFEYIRTMCSEYNYHSVIVGPEKPLAEGLVDYLQQHDIHCIGPSRTLAQVESSKIYTRRLFYENYMHHLVPKVLIVNKYTDIVNILSFIEQYENGVVVKCDGLCGGKGVYVYDKDTTPNVILSKINELTDTYEELLLEERLYGNEFSLISIVNNTSFIHTPPILDFKRLENKDKGPNTGSMGCIMGGTLGFLSSDDIKKAEIINEFVVKSMVSIENQYYNGFLYGSFMKTTNGDIKVIEYNCRLGDPEGIMLLESMKTSLSDICVWMNNNTFEKNRKLVEFDTSFKICKYLVPKGYPEQKITNTLDIRMLTDQVRNKLYMGGLILDTDEWTLTGSRILAMVANSEYEIDLLFKQIGGHTHWRTDLTERYEEKVQSNKSYLDIGLVSSSLAEQKMLIRSTYNDMVLSDESSFGGMFSLKSIVKDYDDPVLVSSTDGVGTKTRFIYNHLGAEGCSILGEDIVYHNINDILVQGAKPLFFLDYFACSLFNPEYFQYFVTGVVKACKKYNISLIGGETAEMPGVYRDKEHDIAGTLVGVVERRDILNGKNIKKGDLVFSIPSYGIHTNGYSLLNKVYKQPIDLDNNKLLYSTLYSTHRCYLNEILLLQKNDIQISGLCHITGGGLIDNPKRIIPEGLSINYTDFKINGVWETIQDRTQLTELEMMRTFNCGVGMMLIVDSSYRHCFNSLINDAVLIGNIQ